MAAGGAVPPCRAPQIAPALSGAATAAGTTHFTIALRNTGNLACTLAAYPTVTLIGGQASAPVQLPLREVELGHAAPSLTLAPGAAGTFVLSLADVPVDGSAICAHARGLAITVDQTAINLAQPMVACGTMIGVFAIMSAP